MNEQRRFITEAVEVLDEDGDTIYAAVARWLENVAHEWPEVGADERKYAVFVSHVALGVGMVGMSSPTPAAGPPLVEEPS